MDAKISTTQTLTLTEGWLVSNHSPRDLKIILFLPFLDRLTL